MSKGNKAVKVRLTQEKLAAIEAEIMRKRKHFATPEDYSVSDFIREAIADKLDHVDRNRKASRKRRLSVKDPRPSPFSMSISNVSTNMHYSADGAMGVLS